MTHSAIIEYSLEDGVNALWMGDLETDFMEAIETTSTSPRSTSCSHCHGCLLVRVPPFWLEKLQPKLVVIGNAPSEYLHHYDGYNTITQNTAGDLLLDRATARVDVYVNDEDYRADYLEKVRGVVDHLNGLITSSRCTCDPTGLLG